MFYPLAPETQCLRGGGGKLSRSGGVYRQSNGGLYLASDKACDWIRSVFFFLELAEFLGKTPNFYFRVLSRLRIGRGFGGFEKIKKKRRKKKAICWCPWGGGGFRIPGKKKPTWAFSFGIDAWTNPRRLEMDPRGNRLAFFHQAEFPRGGLFFSCK